MSIWIKESQTPTVSSGVVQDILDIVEKSVTPEQMEEIIEILNENKIAFE